MSEQIKREHVFANFRPPVRERVKKKPSAAEKREGNSEKHLACIRLLPCCVSGKWAPNDPHHLKQHLSHERGVGRRSTDRWAVPLSRVKHDELERLGSRKETAWFQEHGIEDPLELAAALWAASPDIPRMTKIVLAHMKPVRASSGKKELT
jgi:hypothetical protein